MSGLAVVALLLAWPQGARAAEAADEAWQFTIAPYIWAFGVDGTVGVRNLNATVNQTFLDVVRESDSLFAFAAHVEARHGPWGAFVDGLYAKIGVNDTAPGPVAAPVSFTNELAFVEFAGLYRVGHWYFGDPIEVGQPDAAPGLALDAVVGGRYTHLGARLEVGALPARQQNVDWVDPLVGARLTADLTSRLQFELSGDIGGFGAGSRLAWSATALLGYRFKTCGIPTTVFGGYRALGQDYQQGSGANRFEWNVILNGPVIGIAFTF